MNDAMPFREIRFAHAADAGIVDGVVQGTVRCNGMLHCVL